MRIWMAHGVVALCALTFAPTSFAIQHANSFDAQFYVGGSIGGTSTIVNQSEVVDSNLFINAAGFTEHLHVDGPNALKARHSSKWALYSGYGKSWRNCYLGAEIFVDLATYRNQNSTHFVKTINNGAGIATNIATISSRTKVNPFQAGIDLRPGFLLTPNSLLYARVGVAYSEIELSADTGITADFSVGPTDSPLSMSAATEKDGAVWRLGAGLEQHVCKSFNVRMDYIFTYFGEAVLFDAKGTFFNNGDIISAANNTKVRVYNNAVMFGLSYLID